MKLATFLENKILAIIKFALTSKLNSTFCLGFVLIVMLLEASQLFYSIMSRNMSRSCILIVMFANFIQLFYPSGNLQAKMTKNIKIYG